MDRVVGRVGRAHGLRGEVMVEVRTDDPERRFGPGASVRTDPGGRTLTVEHGRVHSGRLLVRFEGIHDRNAADALRGALLVVEIDPQERPDDPEEFYDHQLEGLRAVTVDGEPLGEVTEVLHLPAQDVLALLRDDSGDELLVPFVSAIVPVVDLEGGRVVVDPPPGLLPEEPPHDGARNSPVDDG